MIGWLGGIALLIPLLSALSSPAVPLGFRLALVVLWALAIARPHWAIAALIVVVPLASWLLEAFDAPPVRYAEALVLATLSGGSISAMRARQTALEGQRPALGPPAIAFCAVVFASAAVMLDVMQAGTHAAWPFVRDLLTFLMRDYLVGPPGSFVGVADAALLAEGIGLALLVARHTRDGVERPAQLFAAFGLAGALAAALTLKTFVRTALEAASVREFLWRIAFSRMGVHVSDVNAAASFFAMVLLVALALAANRRHARAPQRPWLRRVWWMSAAALILAAMWITGSRMAVVAVTGVACVALMTAGPLRLQRWPRWTIATAAIAAALLIAMLAIGLDPRASAGRSLAQMLSTRADFMQTGLRMIASAPIFGVGIGRYFETSGRFMPSSIYWFYFHENAHNNFLQIGGELGLVGLAAFLWVLAAAGIRIVQGVRSDRDDRLLIGALAALGAFVATWITSHPMLVAEIAYPFWILLGVALARADGDAQPPRASDRRVAPLPTEREHLNTETAEAAAKGPTVSQRTLRALRSNVAVSERLPAPASVAGRGVSRATIGAVLLAIALAASVPPRAKREMAGLDFGRLSFGFYDWETGTGGRFRWTSRRATFFIPLTARTLHLPLRAIHLGGNTKPIDVSIAIGGRTFNRVRLSDDDWTTVSMRLPLMAQHENFQRIDIITEPTWSPAAVFGGRSDVRVLGVQVGEAITAP